jgi:hypothetical protein
MHWPDRKVVEALADVGQYRLALGWGGWGHLRFNSHRFGRNDWHIKLNHYRPFADLG